MPDWLKENETSFTPGKKETFLIKNQKGLLFILAKFTSGTHSKNRFSVVHPMVRLVILLTLILLTSLTKSFLVLWLIALYLGGLLLFLPAFDLRKVLQRALILSVMPFFIYLPTLIFFQSQPLFLLRLPLVTTAVSLFAASTDAFEFLSTLKSLRLPDVVLLQLDITIKYIYFFGHLLLEMLKAIRARAVGNQLKLALGTSLFGIIYLKALAYGRQLNWAMEARCFNGEYFQLKRQLTKQDQLTVLAHFLLFIGLIYLGGN